MVVAPVVAYGDFECTLEKKMSKNDDDDDGGGTTEVSHDGGIVGENDLEDIGVRQMYQEHHGISWYVRVACVNKDFTLPSALVKSDIPYPQQEPYIGYDAPEKLLDYTTALANAYLDHYVSKPVEMTFTEEDAKRHAEATECYICQQRYPPPKHHVHNVYEALHPKHCDDCHNNEVLRQKKSFF